MKSLVKQLLPFLCSKMGLGSFYSGLGHVLMLHRVIPEEQVSHFGLRNYEVTIKEFNLILRRYKQLGYTFCSMDELWDLADHPSRRVFLTFDDGYKDTYKYALPILNELDIPCTIYFVKNYLERLTPKYDYFIEDLVCRGKLRKDTIGNDIANLNSFQQVSVVSSQLKKLNNDVKFFDLLQYINTYGDPLDMTDELMMSSSELKDLSGSSLVNIGSHSTNHFVLENCSDQGAYNELLESKLYLEAITGSEIVDFCYPYGSWTKRDIQYAKKLGFKRATTTWEGNLFSNSEQFSLALPRYNARPKNVVRHTNLINSGFYHFQSNRFIKVPEMLRY